MHLLRIIPTHVGTRGNSFRSAVRTEDHPHACGDKNRSIRLTGREAGSSPRVWGQGLGGECRDERLGIIPTRVGTSTTVQRTPTCVVGSSPRVWGQVCKKLNINVENRIIPTRVGTRCWQVSPKDTRQDHPHACGDKAILFIRADKNSGSSPRVWGQEP